MPSSVLESALAVASLLLHAISWYTKNKCTGGFQCWLAHTSPFVTRGNCDRPREASEEFVEYAQNGDVMTTIFYLFFFLFIKLMQNNAWIYK